MVSGKEVLLPAPPLRTARDSFPSCSSSLSDARCQTRFHHGEALAVDLPMAVGMKEHTVLCGIRSAMRAPHDVVVVPPCQCGDPLVADRAEAILLFPGDYLGVLGTSRGARTAVP